MPDVERLLEDLTPPQREAAMHVDGPLLIIAGAGSGKTRVITRRVAYLLAQGIRPWSVLAITFTNKAAAEMKSRVAAVIDGNLRDFGRLDQPWPLICTFHSLCLRILKYYGPRVGLPNNFSIFDTSDQNKLIKEAVKSLDLSSDNFAPATVHGTISNAKNQLIGPDEFSRTAKDFYQRNVARVYVKYQSLLKQNNALDFDDLLLRTAHALREHPDVLGELQDRFGYLLIDEYQDTNHAQYVLAHALAMRHKNICVVGDPDQSIYAWRGADLRNILDFEKDYPDAKVVRLEQNYRSTKRILRIASKLIANNTQRKDKSLWTENADGEPADLFLCQDEHDEAAMIAAELRKLHDKKKVEWSKMAIFYRMNALSRVMEAELRKATIPYQIVRGVEFYNRKEIKDALAYLRIVANPNDEVSLTRIINVPARGLGDAAIKTLSTYAAAKGITLWQALGAAAGVPGVSTRAAAAAGQFMQLVEGWREKAFGTTAQTISAPARAAETSGQHDESIGNPDAENSPANAETDGSLFDFPPMPAEMEFTSPDSAEPSEPLELEDSAYTDVPEEDGAATPPEPAPRPILRHAGPRKIAELVFRTSGLEAYLKKTGGEELDELHNVEELITSAAEFEKENPQGSLGDFLAQIALVSDTDNLKDGGGAVTLMTLHAAKGLEFPVVAMIGLEEGILPHSRARESESQLEEERRLCFVGITRAQERVILSKAARRAIRGVSERTIPSPFLQELPLEDLKVTDRTGIDGFPTSHRNWNPPGRSSARKSEEYTPPAPRGGKFSHLRRGQLIRHATLGVGRIRDIEHMSEDRTRATVQFNTGGVRTLYLEFAPLEMIED